MWLIVWCFIPQTSRCDLESVGNFQSKFLIWIFLLQFYHSGHMEKLRNMEKLCVIFWSLVSLIFLICVQEGSMKPIFPLPHLVCWQLVYYLELIYVSLTRPRGTLFIRNFTEFMFWRIFKTSFLAIHPFI